MSNLLAIVSTILGSSSFFSSRQILMQGFIIYIKPYIIQDTKLIIVIHHNKLLMIICNLHSKLQNSIINIII